MATYKVLQDIEAEDKLIGPLTPRQCIYAAIAIVSIYLSYLLFSRGVAFLAVFLLPFMAFGIFFAFPWRKEQSTEVWALARVRFALKPRRRIWDQNGTKNLVTVTAPVQVSRRGNTITQTEVVSRLQALANTIDSRGWAVKNVPVSLYASSGNMVSASDRLSGGSSLAPSSPGPGMYDSTDIFDVAANPLASELESKMAAAANNKRQQLVDVIDPPAASSQPAQTNSMPAVQQPSQASAQTGQGWYAPAPRPAVAPGHQAFTSMPAASDTTAQDKALMAQNMQQSNQQAPAEPVQGQQMRQVQQGQQMGQPGQSQLTQQGQSQQPQAVQPAVPSYSNIRTPQPQQGPVAAPVSTPTAVAVTPPVNPAILELANNNDLTIATIAREANQMSGNQQADTMGSADGQPPQNGEVTVSLH